MSELSYPALEPIAPAVSPTAPVGFDLAVCVQCTSTVAQGSAKVVLSCGHQFHLHCALPFCSAMHRSQNALDDSKWCTACQQTEHDASGVRVDRDHLDAENVSQCLNNVQRRLTGVDVLRDIEILEPSIALEQRLLGTTANLGSRFVRYLSRSAVDESVEASPVPDTLSVRLKQGGETLDSIFTRCHSVTIAHLHTAGIRTLDELRALGFSPDRHLSREYRTRLPVFVLASYYGLAWENSGLRNADPRRVAKLGLRAPELWLLGATIADFIQAQWKAPHLFALRIPPDQLIKYCDLNRAHINALGITLSAAKKHTLWRDALREKCDAVGHLFEQ